MRRVRLLKVLPLVLGTVYPFDVRCFASELPPSTKIANLERRLARVEKVLERMEGKESPDRGKVLGDASLMRAIAELERKYGITTVAETLSGTRTTLAGAAVPALHRRIIRLLHEEGEKTSPDKHLLTVVSALFRLRGAELGASLSAGRGALLLDPDDPAVGASRDGENAGTAPARIHGALGKALATTLLVECLNHPALERHAADEAHLFPAAIVGPTLAKRLRELPPRRSARRRRLLAAHAACGDAKALRAIRDEILGERDNYKWLKKVADRYAPAGKPFGLLALSRVAERELRDQRLSGNATRYLPRGAGSELMAYIGREADLTLRFYEIHQEMTEEERKDARLYREQCREATLEIVGDAVEWIRLKYDKLVWDESGKAFQAK